MLISRMTRSLRSVSILVLRAAGQQALTIVLPTLNLTSFSESGPPPTDHIPKQWSFTASK